jgi:hypothetical protein
VSVELEIPEAAAKITETERDAVKSVPKTVTGVPTEPKEGYTFTTRYAVAGFVAYVVAQSWYRYPGESWMSYLAASAKLRKTVSSEAKLRCSLELVIEVVRPPIRPTTHNPRMTTATSTSMSVSPASERAQLWARAERVTRSSQQHRIPRSTGSSRSAIRE